MERVIDIFYLCNKMDKNIQEALKLPEYVTQDENLILQTKTLEPSIAETIQWNKFIDKDKLVVKFYMFSFETFFPEFFFFT